VKVFPDSMLANFLLFLPLAFFGFATSENILVDSAEVSAVSNPWYNTFNFALASGCSTGVVTNTLVDGVCTAINLKDTSSATSYCLSFNTFMAIMSCDSAGNSYTVSVYYGGSCSSSKLWLSYTGTSETCYITNWKTYDCGFTYNPTYYTKGICNSVNTVNPTRKPTVVPTKAPTPAPASCCCTRSDSVCTDSCHGSIWIDFDGDPCSDCPYETCSTAVTPTRKPTVVPNNSPASCCCTKAPSYGSDVCTDCNGNIYSPCTACQYDACSTTVTPTRKPTVVPNVAPTATIAPSFKPVLAPTTTPNAPTSVVATRMPASTTAENFVQFWNTDNEAACLTTAPSVTANMQIDQCTMFFDASTGDTGYVLLSGCDEPNGEWRIDLFEDAACTQLIGSAVGTDSCDCHDNVRVTCGSNFNTCIVYGYIKNCDVNTANFGAAINGQCSSEDSAEFSLNCAGSYLYNPWTLNYYSSFCSNMALPSQTFSGTGSDCKFTHLQEGYYGYASCSGYTLCTESDLLSACTGKNGGDAGSTASNSGSSSLSSSAGPIAGGVVAGVVVVVAFIVFFLYRNGWKIAEYKKVTPVPINEGELQLKIFQKPV
jgi:hypothetical protein